MKLQVQSVFSAILAFSIVWSISSAQEKSGISEPPIPVYNLSHHRSDSVTAHIAQSDIQLVSAMRRSDSLEQQIQKNSAENSNSAAVLYAIIILLILTNGGLLIAVLRIRKRLALKAPSDRRS